MFLAAQDCLHHRASVVGTVPKVHDLDGVLKIQLAQVLQAVGPVNEEDGLLRLAQAAADGLLAQERPKVPHRPQRGDIGGGFVIPHRVACFIRFVLGKDAPEVGRPGFGTAVGLLAGPPFEFLLAPGHAGGVTADIEYWCRQGSRQWV